ncbi:MAG: cytochrome c3 family protein [Deltaproteobacteria bacterium]|nr:cytochrome c3 family protein [Deltaproteobacteria bacterium]
MKRQIKYIIAAVLLISVVLFPVCHVYAVEDYWLNHDEESLGNCRECHLLHDEKVAHDAHVIVECEACHLQKIIPVKDPESKRVSWQFDGKPGEEDNLADLAFAVSEENCQRCHIKRNRVGAAAMALPAKSLLCMPCHPATFSVGDTTTIVSLFVFLLGILSLLSVWISGNMAGDKEMGLGIKVHKISFSIIGALFSVRILHITKALAFDALLQRRLYRQSRLRWLIHSLIFFPFVFRFSWGMVALLSSLWVPEKQLAWAMLDKNYPVGAFLFDMTGVMVISGVILAMFRRVFRKSENLPGLPNHDWPASSLIGGIIIIGFILEGMRIAMTGSPEGAQYAFIGYGISRFFTDIFGLTDIYGYIWYGHAIFVGAFLAYLPFSRMLHIIMAPVVIAMNAGKGFAGKFKHDPPLNRIT